MQLDTMSVHSMLQGHWETSFLNKRIGLSVVGGSLKSLFQHLLMMWSSSPLTLAFLGRAYLYLLDSTTNFIRDFRHRNSIAKRLLRSSKISSVFIPAMRMYDIPNTCREYKPCMLPNNYAVASTEWTTSFLETFK
jgi:hypothetical protein